MKRSRMLKTTLGFDGLWKPVFDLLSFRNAKEIPSMKESPESFGRVSVGMLNEVLGGWLWTHA